MYRFSITEANQMVIKQELTGLILVLGLKKFVHPNDLSDADKAYDASRIEAKYAPDIRYAEILLNYAEALNEVQGTYEIPSWNGEKCIL